MIQVGRYERVRVMSTLSDVLSPSLIYDTKKSLLYPVDNDAWAQFMPHVRDVCFRGGTQYNFFSAMNLVLNMYQPTSLTISPSTHHINTAYTAGSAGACYAILFWQGLNSNITDIYIRTSGYNGTASLVTSINVEVRTYDSSTNKPITTGPGLLGSGTINPASVVGWVKLSGLNIATTFEQPFFVCVGDADVVSPNYVIMLVSSSPLNQFTTPMLSISGAALTSTNGFSSITVIDGSNAPCCVIKYADGSVQGNSLSTSTAHANNSVVRGMYMADVAFSCKIFAIYSQVSTASTLTGKIFDGTTLPGGTALFTSSGHLNPSTLRYGVWFVRPFPQLRVGNAYRVVLVPGANYTGPQRWRIGTGSDTTLKKGMPGYGSWYQTDESGGAWSDTTDEIPALGLIVEDLVAESASVYQPDNQRTYPRLAIGS